MTTPTREQCIQWAREAGFIPNGQTERAWLERFAALAYAAGAADENEACAKTCETLRFSALGPSFEAQQQRNYCAAAIRARKEKK